jgi:hypothetical protein
MIRISKNVDGSCSGLFEGTILVYSRTNRKSSNLSQRVRVPRRKLSQKLPECKAGVFTLEYNFQSWTVKTRRTPHVKCVVQPTNQNCRSVLGCNLGRTQKQWNLAGIFSESFSLQTWNDANLITGLSLEASDECHYLRRSQSSSYNLIRQTLQNYDVNAASRRQYNAPITTSVTTRNSQYGTASIDLLPSAKVSCIQLMCSVLRLFVWREI